MRHDARNTMQCSALGCTANIILCISGTMPTLDGTIPTMPPGQGTGPQGFPQISPAPVAGEGEVDQTTGPLTYRYINPRPIFTPHDLLLRLPFAILSPAVFCHLRWSDALPAGSGSTPAVDRQPRLSTGRGTGFTAGRLVSGWSAVGRRPDSVTVLPAPSPKHKQPPPPSTPTSWW